MALLSKLLRSTGIGLLLAVVVAGPYFRGLFFWSDLLVGIAVAAAGGALWILGRRLGRLPLGLPGGPAGWALLGLTLCYLMLFPWAAYMRGNLDTFLRVFTTWLAYVAVRGEAGPAARRWIGWTVVAGSAAVALTGLLEFTGYFARSPEIASALSLVGLQSRLFTVYQYPNTGAAVFMATVLVAVGLGLDDGARAWRMGLAGALAGLVSVAFFFTLSRGAVVVLPFGILFLLIGFNWTRVWQGLMTLGGFLVAPILVSMNGVARYLPTHNWSAAMKWVGIAVAVGAVAGLALGALFRLKGRVQAGVAAGLVVIALAGFVALRPAGPLVPKMANRLFDMNFRTVNVVLRLTYDHDAAKIVASQPLGHGGWGWERTYRQVQSFNYFVRETHDQYAQTAVEAGVQGLLLLLAGIGISLWLAWRNRKGDPLRWALAAGGALLAAHAAIDFDFSFYPVWLTLWILLAVAAPGPSETAPSPAAPAPEATVPAAAPRGALASRFAWLALFVPAIGAAVLAGWLTLGSRRLDRAEDLLGQKKEDAARAEAAASRRYDPWNSRPLQILGGAANLQEAIKLDPHNAELWRDLSIALELKKDHAGAVAAARKALENQPAVTDYYEIYARQAGFQLDYALANGDMATARTLATDLAGVARQLAERRAVADPLQHWWNSPPLKWTNMIYLHTAKGLYLTGDEKTAEEYFKLSAREWQFAAEADVYRYAMYEKQGRTADLKPLENKPWVRFRNLNKTYLALKNWKQ